MTGTAAVRDVLLAAGLIADDGNHEFDCRALADAARGGAQRVAERLDAHRLAAEDDPDTRVIAQHIVEAVERAQ